MSARGLRLLCAALLVSTSACTTTLEVDVDVYRGPVSDLAPPEWMLVDRLAVDEELDARLWHNLNHIRIERGPGDPTLVLTNDDLGNWYVRTADSLGLDADAD